MSSYGSESWESRKLPLWSRVSRDASGRRESRKLPLWSRVSRDASGRRESRKLPLWSRVSRDASGRPSRDASRRSTPPDHKAGGSRHCDGGAHGGEICPSRELDDPLASQQPCRGLLGPEALPLVGRAPGCDLSDPSQVMEPRGPTSHTAMAMDPVHGNQSSFGSTDVTLTAQ